ncbi:MAG: hypothetical protein GY755_19975 [Chloroflexi bacterium]|nr:hypothetical protein [Chloroflexota bacterium]
MQFWPFLSHYLALAIFGHFLALFGHFLAKNDQKWQKMVQPSPNTAKRQAKIVKQIIGKNGRKMSKNGQNNS